MGARALTIFAVSALASGVFFTLLGVAQNWLPIPDLVVRLVLPCIVSGVVFTMALERSGTNDGRGAFLGWLVWLVVMPAAHLLTTLLDPWGGASAFPAQVLGFAAVRSLVWVSIPLIWVIRAAARGPGRDRGA
ncbi:MAG: hypothetical protein U0234_29210 [Sandaracinus sp.]